MTFCDAVYQPRVGQSARIRDALLVLGGSLLLIASAKIRIGGPIPFTMQPWAVILLGAALGSRRGALAVGAYLLQGLSGLPVFANPGAGPAYFMGPTAGYLLSFVPAAYVVGWLAERGWDRRFVTAVSALAIGNAIILFVGAMWLSAFVGAQLAVADGIVKFLVGDALKILLAATALPAAWKLVGNNHRTV
ncbi:MAG: biotin transporter BioY [Planctomycetes bacterium]|nr:biotin transporter BioY [Planctomycetota bacterium]